MSNRIMASKLLAFLLPLCHVRDNSNILEKVSSNPIFDRNVIGLVTQFAVCFILICILL